MALGTPPPRRAPTLHPSASITNFISNSRSMPAPSTNERACGWPAHCLNHCQGILDKLSILVSNLGWFRSALNKGVMRETIEQRIDNPLGICSIE